MPADEAGGSTFIASSSLAVDCASTWIDATVLLEVTGFPGADVPEVSGEEVLPGFAAGLLFATMGVLAGPAGQADPDELLGPAGGATGPTTGAGELEGPGAVPAWEPVDVAPEPGPADGKLNGVAPDP